MAIFFEFQAEDDGNNSSDDAFYKDNGEVSLSSFIDNSIYDNNPSDYFGFKHISRSVESAEKDAFSDSDIRHFCDENIEARNYCLNSDDETAEEDNFQNAAFNKTLMTPRGKDTDDCLISCSLLCNSF